MNTPSNIDHLLLSLSAQGGSGTNYTELFFFNDIDDTVADTNVSIILMMSDILLVDNSLSLGSFTPTSVAPPPMAPTQPTAEAPESEVPIPEDDDDEVGDIIDVYIVGIPDTMDGGDSTISSGADDASSGGGGGGGDGNSGDAWLAALIAIAAVLMVIFAILAWWYIKKARSRRNLGSLCLSRAGAEFDDWAQAIRGVFSHGGGIVVSGKSDDVTPSGADANDAYTGDSLDLDTKASPLGSFRISGPRTKRNKIRNSSSSSRVFGVFGAGSGHVAVASGSSGADDSSSGGGGGGGVSTGGTGGYRNRNMSEGSRGSRSGLAIAARGWQPVGKNSVHSNSSSNTSDGSKARAVPTSSGNLPPTAGAAAMRLGLRSLSQTRATTVDAPPAREEEEEEEEGGGHVEVEMAREKKFHNLKSSDFIFDNTKTQRNTERRLSENFATDAGNDVRRVQHHEHGRNVSTDMTPTRISATISTTTMSGGHAISRKQSRDVPNVAGAHDNSGSIWTANLLPFPALQLPPALANYIYSRLPSSTLLANFMAGRPRTHRDAATQHESGGGEGGVRRVRSLTLDAGAHDNLGSNERDEEANNPTSAHATPSPIKGDDADLEDIQLEEVTIDTEGAPSHPPHMISEEGSAFAFVSPSTAPAMSAPVPPASPTSLRENPNMNIDFHREIELGERLGGGASGSVYMATYEGVDVAAKILHSQEKLTPREVKAFVMEVELLRKLRHDNIIGFYGACVAKPRLCIVQELAFGSLYDFLHVRLLRSKYSLPYFRQFSSLDNATIQFT